jgi:hypothetical protein
VYIDYDEYLEYGGTAEISAFPRLEFMARKKIDRYTQSRVKAMKEVPESVKRCMTELVNAMVNADPTKTASQATLTGFSNDGYSESYGDAITAETLENNLYGIVKELLSGERDDNGTPLLWLGVEP